MHLTTGSLVGPYRVLSAVGAGGMGEVYRARDEKLNRDIALKILSADLAASSEHLRRFEQEARAASALNHPNIIGIYDIGRADDGVAYIAMELVEGNDVRNFGGGAPLPLKQVLRIAVKVADGLAAAHERGIVHRDLKPENVMVSYDGFVKILDFGLAKLAVPIAETDATIPHTTPGALFGTVGYMSPEQAAGRAADFRSDQFALGVMMYEMLTGRLPFSEATAAETLAAIIRTEPKPIDNPDLPLELIRIVERCLAKDPAERYASTRDLARDIREVRDSMTHPSDWRLRSGKASILPARRAGVWIGGVAGAVMLLAASVVMFQRHGHSTAAGAGDVRTVAVASFADSSDTPAGKDFGDGIAHAISGRLSSSGRLRALGPLELGAATTSEPRGYARQRGADLVLRGTVQRAADRIRITFSLVDLRSGGELLTDGVTGPSSQLFALEDQVADAVLRALKVSPPARAPALLSSELTSAADQTAYTEAVGILQRSKDEATVDAAIRLLEGVLVNARDSAAVNALLGRAMLNKSMLSRNKALLEQASIYAERAVELDPSLPEGHIALGHIRNATDKPKEGAEHFQRALALRPDSKEPVLGMADSMNAMGRASEAERLYKKAIALDPQWPAPYNKYGLFLFALGRCTDAVVYEKRFVELMPDVPRAQTNLGAAYQCMGRYEDALRAYQRSTEISPTGAALANLSYVLMLLRRYPEACDAARRAVETTPTDVQILTNLGDVYRWSPGMREKSIEAYDRAVQTARESLATNPRNALVHALLAGCIAKRGDAETANAEIINALKINPTDGIVLYNAAVVANLRGSSDTALAWLQRAVAAGYPIADVRNDPEFEALRHEPAFQSLGQQTRKTP